MSGPSFDDAFIEDLDQNNPETVENIPESDNLFLFANASKKTDSVNAVPSVLRSTKSPIGYNSPPDRFCVWELAGMTPNSKSELTYRDESVTKTPSISPNDDMQLIVSSDDSSVSKEVSMICNTMSPESVKSEIFDSPVIDASLEKDRILDCVWEARANSSPSVGPVKEIRTVPCTNVSTEALNFKTSKQKTNLRKRKHTAYADVGNNAERDNSVVEDRNTGRDEKKSLPVLSSNVNALDQENAEIAAGSDGFGTAVSSVFSGGNSMGFACNLSPLNAIKATGCVWEIMPRDAMHLRKSVDLALRSDLVENIAAEERSLFFSQLMSVTNDLHMDDRKNGVDLSATGISKANFRGHISQGGDIDFQLDPATLELGFETSVPSRPAVKRQRRKSVSADQQIASQLLDGNILKSGFDDARANRRHSLRLRRRSTELVPCSKQKFCIELPSVVEFESEKVELTSEVTTAFPVTNDAHSDETFTNIIDQASLVGKLAPSDTEIQMDALNSEDFSICSEGSKRSLRRSTELYRAAKSNQCSFSSSSFNETSEDGEVNVLSSKSSSAKKSKKVSKPKDKLVDEPPLEDLYLNKLWRLQMPKESSWETIYEHPKISKNTGDYKFFSTYKSRRFLNFEEGPSPLHLRLRKQKAVKLGWKPMTKKRYLKLSKLVVKKLSHLDKEIEMMSTVI